MRTGKVIVTDLQGKGKKVFHSGDSVNESSFPEGNFAKLVAGGYIKEDLTAKASEEPKKGAATDKDLEKESEANANTEGNEAGLGKLKEEEKPKKKGFLNKG